MDETAKLSHICPQQNKDQIESTDTTAHDIFLVVKDKKNEERLRIVQLDPEKGEVTSVGEIPYLDWTSIVVCVDSIFFLGDYFFSGLVHEFDLVKRTVKTPTRWLEPVRWSASAASSHEVIVSGGQNKIWQEVATCSVYAPATNRWTSLQQLRQVRHSHRMGWLPDGRVFAIGGYSNGEYFTSVEMLERAWIPAPREEASAEWQNVSPMKMGRSEFGCCVVEGRIVVAGGQTPGEISLIIESFEPPTPTNLGQWTSLTNLASAVGRCCLVPSAAGLVLIDVNNCGMQLGRRKAQVASNSEWTWEPRPRLTSFRWCLELLSLPLTAGASQR